MPTAVGDTAAEPGPYRPLVGVLALQGAFAAHEQRLIGLDVRARPVRTPADLEGLDALVLPGGESTTMSRLLTTSGLFDELRTAIRDGMPTLGTCAGLILCATEVLDARPDQRSFGRIDVSARRNAYGRQRDSFEADVEVTGLDQPFHAVFIRAPVVERTGDDVEVLAEHDGRPVLLRDGTCTVAAFHPELTDDSRLHEMFLDQLSRRPAR